MGQEGYAELRLCCSLLLCLHCWCASSPLAACAYLPATAPGARSATAWRHARCTAFADCAVRILFCPSHCLHAKHVSRGTERYSVAHSQVSADSRFNLVLYLAVVLTCRAYCQLHLHHLQGCSGHLALLDDLHRAQLDDRCNLVDFVCQETCFLLLFVSAGGCLRVPCSAAAAAKWLLLCASTAVLTELSSLPCRWMCWNVAPQHRKTCLPLLPRATHVLLTGLHRWLLQADALEFYPAAPQQG